MASLLSTALTLLLVPSAWAQSLAMIVPPPDKCGPQECRGLPAIPSNYTPPLACPTNVRCVNSTSTSTCYQSTIYSTEVQIVTAMKPVTITKEDLHVSVVFEEGPVPVGRCVNITTTVDPQPETVIVTRVSTSLVYTTTQITTPRWTQITHTTTRTVDCSNQYGDTCPTPEPNSTFSILGPRVGGAQVVVSQDDDPNKDVDSDDDDH